VWFEWDERKNRANLRKHGLDFANAWEVFRGPMLVYADVREGYGEDRWLGIGMLRGEAVFLVFTQPQTDVIRIISMRKASRNERQEYEKAIQD
jgi:uncharacterized protein